MHKIRIFITGLICLLSTISFGQDDIEPDLIMNNQIRIIEGYNVSLVDSSIQTLKSIEHFNTKGRRTSIKIFNENNSISEYQYLYENDTLLVTRITKFNDKLHSRTLFKYDRVGREIEASDLDSLGNPTGTYSRTKYKKGGRIKECKLYFGNKLYRHSKEIKKLDDVGMVYFEKRNNRWLEWQASEDKVETVQNINGTDLIRSRRIHLVKNPKRIIGIIDQIDLEKDDELITDKYINKKGLVEKEIQYLNSKMIAMKKYIRIVTAKLRQ